MKATINQRTTGQKTFFDSDRIQHNAQEQALERSALAMIAATVIEGEQRTHRSCKRGLRIIVIGGDSAWANAR